MTEHGISRRAALRLLVWWVGLGASPLRAFAAEEMRKATGSAGAPSTPFLLRHRQSAVSIGRAFLSEHPDEANEERLVEKLGLPLSATPLSRGEQARQGERLLELHRQDLRNGRVVNLGGWILSVTELRLAALLALATEPHRE